MAASASGLRRSRYFVNDQRTPSKSLIFWRGSFCCCQASPSSLCSRGFQLWYWWRCLWLWKAGTSLLARGAVGWKTQRKIRLKVKHYERITGKWGCKPSHCTEMIILSLLISRNALSLLSESQFGAFACSVRCRNIGITCFFSPSPPTHPLRTLPYK